MGRSKNSMMLFFYNFNSYVHVPLTSLQRKFNKHKHFYFCNLKNVHIQII